MKWKFGSPKIVSFLLLRSNDEMFRSDFGNAIRGFRTSNPDCINCSLRFNALSSKLTVSERIESILSNINIPRFNDLDPYWICDLLGMLGLSDALLSFRCTAE
jgi:hypothetical protein